MNDDYMFPESEENSGSRKKSRFERDLERFGSASAVKAAKAEDEEIKATSGKRRKSGSAVVAAALGVESSENADYTDTDSLLDPPPDTEVHFNESPTANPYAPGGFDAAMEDYNSMADAVKQLEEEFISKNNHADLSFAGIAQEIEEEFRDVFGVEEQPTAETEEAIAAAMEEAIPEIARRPGQRRRASRPLDEEAKTEMFTPLSPEEYAITADLIKQVESHAETIAQTENAGGTSSSDDGTESSGAQTLTSNMSDEEIVVKLQPVMPQNAEVFSRVAVNDGSYDLEHEIRTGTLPKLGDLNDDLSTEKNGKIGRSTKSDDDIAKMRKLEATAVSALAEKEKVEEEAPRISMDIAATNEKKQIRLGRILLYVSNGLAVAAGIAGILMFPEIKLHLTYLLYAFIAVGGIGFIPFKVMQKVVAILYLVLLFATVIAGLLGTAGSLNMTMTVFFLICTAVSLYGFGIQAFAYPVKCLYQGRTL